MDGHLVFTYRPWGVLRRRALPIPGRVAVAEGLVSPVLVRDERRAGFTVARFPPRYRGRADEIADVLGKLPTEARAPAGDPIAWLRGAEVVAPRQRR